MSSSTKRNLMLVSSILLAAVAVAWAIGEYRGFKPDETVDNGMNSTIPGPPPETVKIMRKIMEDRRASGKPMPPPPEKPGDIDPEAAREIASTLTEEEREIMRENLQRMMEQRRKIQRTLGPHEARAFETKMRTRIMQGMRRMRNNPPASPAE